MRPMLDDLELPNVQEINTRDKRSLAEHKPPGMEGSQHQDLGRRPTGVVLCGVATGSEAQQFVEQLDGKFRAGELVTFIADIVADAEIQQVRIADAHFQELAGKPERFAYVLTLRESVEPPEADEPSLLDADILAEADGLIDDIVDGLDIAPVFATGLEQFVQPLSGLLERLRNANSNL